MKKILILFVLIFCPRIFGFIPPVPYILDLIRDERKVSVADLILRHQIEIRPGEIVQLEERIVHRPGATLLTWTLPNERQTASAQWDARGYALGKDRAFTPLVSVWMKYLIASSAEELQQALIADGFVRREQLLQFKGGFVPQGDPQTWNFKENYALHPDIFLQRLPSGVAIEVLGFEEGGRRRAVYFDKNLRGIERFEWKEGSQSNVAWSMNNFVKTPLGALPKSFTFESNGRVLVQSQLVQAASMSEKIWNDFRNTWKSSNRPVSSLSPVFESALKVLLSVR